MDWSNPDVIRLFEHMKSRVDKVEQENQQIKSRMEEVEQENQQLQKENEQLRMLLGQQPSAAGSGSTDGSIPKNVRKKSNSRSYNVRKFNDYPHTERAAPKETPKTNAVARTCTADIKVCPECGKSLSDWSEEYAKISEDTVDGWRTETQWTATRRYCKSCKKDHRLRARRTAEGALRHAYHGNSRIPSLHVPIL